MSDVERQIAAFHRRMEAMPAGLKAAVLAVLQQNADELAAAIRQLAEESRLTGELIASIQARRRRLIQWAVRARCCRWKSR